MSVTRTIAKNTLFGFFETGADIITAFILGIVIARSLGAEQYGLYAYLTWLLALAALIIDLGLSEMSKRFIAEALGKGNHRHATGLIRLTLIIRCAAAILIALIFSLAFIFSTTLSESANSNVLFILLAATILPHGLNYAFISIFRGFQKYEYATYVTLSTAPLRLILISAFLFTGSGVKEVLLVQMGTFVLGAVVGVYLLSRLIPLKDLLLPRLLDPIIRKQALKYAITLAGTAIVSYLACNQFSTFFIELYCPVDQVGFFRLAARIVAIPMSLVPTAFSFVLTPAIAEQFGRGDTGKIKSIYITSARYLMIVALPLETGMIALAGPIVLLLYGAEYAPAIIIMRILLITSAIIPVSQAAGAVVYGTNRPGFLFKLNLIFALVSIGLSFWFIPAYGVIGAATIGIIPSIFMATLIIRYASKKIGATWPVGDTIKISISAIIMGLIVFGFQSHLNSILSLTLGIPLGVVTYIVLIFLLRVFNEQDLTIIKNITGSLPLPLRKPYIHVSGLIEKIVSRKKFATGQ